MALSRLNLAIDDVDRMIKDEVSMHSTLLLQHSHSILSLSAPLSNAKTTLAALDHLLVALSNRISQPYQSLKRSRKRLEKVRQAQVLVDRAAKFVSIANRLAGLIDDESDSTSDLGSDSDSDASVSSRRSIAIDKSQSSSKLPLTSLHFVASYIPTLDAHKDYITDAMESTVVLGLRDLNPALLSISLTTAFNLGSLRFLVRDLMGDLREVIKSRVKAALDPQALAKETGVREPSTSQYASYKSRHSSRPGASSATMDGALTPQQHAWSTTFWQKLNVLLISEMSAVCCKVYALEGVLRLKRDEDSGRGYLEETLETLGDRPSFMFWTTFAQSFEMQSQEALKASPFLAEQLVASYPRLVRLFQDFFQRVSNVTELNYTDDHQSPETVVVLRSASHLETSYVQRVHARLSDSVAALAAGKSRAAGSSRTANAALADGERLARTISNELDGARFDPLLLRAVAAAVEKCTLDALEKLEKIVAKDASAYTLAAIETTPSQFGNADLANGLTGLARGLHAVNAESPSAVRGLIGRLEQRASRLLQDELLDPLLQSTKKELTVTFARMHNVDFAKGGAASSDGSGAAAGVATGAGSVYMAEVSDRLWYVREMLALKYEDETRSRITLELAIHALDTFVLHASLVRPLGESGALKLSSDTTELEFATSQMLQASPRRVSSARMSAGVSQSAQQQTLTLADCGAPFQALRSFRPLLFKDLDGLADKDLLPSSSGLSPLRGWSKSEYVRWIQTRHDARDALSLLWATLDQHAHIDVGMGSAGKTVQYLQRWKQVVEHSDAIRDA
ncbi:Predicted Golgi transport complex 1 protein [Ceraceosorus bombacis]|uniref:Conserved oligomeric Golgi complex subunit 5 n=1 Tax=Ceraceosorus bombacis TaxID=401625 RepID=A0A0P1BA53_9BASI|nr:Predicted Golgi transport complex 1 protein [Ceraceosorus bombacis]